MGSDTTRIFDHFTDVVSGWSADLASELMYTAKLSANVTVDLPRGRVVHVNSDGEFETGVPDAEMPIFLFQSSTDHDVENTGANPNATGYSPSGEMSGIVGGRCYEIETTEFDSAQSYAYNDSLTAVNANSNATTGGRLTNQSAVLYTNPVCGIVSKTPSEDHNGVETLGLWTVFIPPVPA